MAMLPPVVRTQEVLKVIFLIFILGGFYVNTLDINNQHIENPQVTAVSPITPVADPTLLAENQQLRLDLQKLVSSSASSEAKVDATLLANTQSENEQLKQQLADLKKSSFSPKSGASSGGGGGGGDLVGRKIAGTVKDALQYTLQNGWEDSTVNVTPLQSHKSNLCLYQGNCNMHGENLLGRCFCLPGFAGKECDTVEEKDPCTNKDDLCFYTEEAGVYAISLDRWHLAQEAELATWNNEKNANAEVGDRIDEHMRDFKEYVDVGADGSNLGNFIEVGSGPWTQVSERSGGLWKTPNTTTTTTTKRYAPHRVCP